mgnify:CR=1 FL=1
MLLGCCLMLVGAGCVGKAEFHPDTPSGGGGEPGEGTAVVSVRYLKTAYTGYPTPVTKDWEVPGVVTANDRYGSFPNALVVQDGTGGIEIKVSGDELMLAFRPAGVRAVPGPCVGRLRRLGKSGDRLGQSRLPERIYSAG